MHLPERVTIVEVGPRDGLQNEAQVVPTALKLQYIEALADSGIGQIEATSFVSPRAVPQLADASEVVRGLTRRPGVIYSALVPNEKGLDRAVEAGIRRIALFTAASDEFTMRNIGVTVDESLRAFSAVAARAQREHLTIRAYVSTAFVCPFIGEVPVARVLDVTARLFDLGADEVAISDTIGAAAPTDVESVVGALLAHHPAHAIALHLHDTFGTALANVVQGLQMGITTFDSSAGGMGGCPYAPGAAGNLATEKLLYLLHRMGIQTGIDREKVMRAAALVKGRAPID